MHFGEIEAFFADIAGGQRFCILTLPAGPVRGCVLYVPPFAEELNKSRRMIALAARAFAAEGWAVLQIDPLGCGDSAGDLSDATWEAWTHEISFGWNLLRQRFNGVPCVLWSLRVGSLLVSTWLETGEARPDCLMWQPVVSGKQHLTQFLRLKAANQMLSASDARTVMASVREALRQGASVEVAGYALCAELAVSMEERMLSFPDGFDRAVAVVEISAAESAELSPALALAIAKWSERGVEVESVVVSGASFWQTQEVEIAEHAIGPSLAFLRGRLECT